MTLAQLRYFCAAARYGSITQAARALYMTQPTISIAVRDLEKEFSSTLFHHEGSRLTLTEEGERFYRKAWQILSTCEELKGEYSGKGSIRSLVRLGIPPLLGSIYFPEMLDSFHVDHPDTWLELLEYGSVRACELVQNEILDIALVNMELPGIAKFYSMVLRQDPLVFCVSPGHPLAGEKLLPLEKLDHEPVILFNRDSVHNQLMQMRFDALQVAPRVIMHSSQIITILRFLEKGNCGCFFYKSMQPLAPHLVYIPLDPEINTRIGLVWKRGRYINQGMNEFLAFSRKYYLQG